MVWWFPLATLSKETCAFRPRSRTAVRLWATRRTSCRESLWTVFACASSIYSSLSSRRVHFRLVRLISTLDRGKTRCRAACISSALRIHLDPFFVNNVHFSLCTYGIFYVAIYILPRSSLWSLSFLFNQNK